MPDRQNHHRPARTIAAALAATIFGLAAPAWAADERPAWVKPAATTALTYGSLYVTVVSAVQITRTAIVALAPVEWLVAAQAFGIPLVLVPMMGQLVPAVRTWAVQTVDGLDGAPAAGTTTGAQAAVPNAASN